MYLTLKLIIGGVHSDGWFDQVGDPFGSVRAAVPKSPSTGLFTDSGASVVFHLRRAGLQDKQEEHELISLVCLSLTCTLNYKQCWTVSRRKSSVLSNSVHDLLTTLHRFPE